LMTTTTPVYASRSPHSKLEDKLHVKGESMR
jgi:hypothetical protein